MGSYGSNARGAYSSQDSSASFQVPQRIVSVQYPPFLPSNNNASSESSFSRPRLDVQPTTVVKNPVYLRKESLRLRQNASNPKKWNIEFLFDATTRVKIIVYVMATESSDPLTSLPSFESDVSFSQDFPAGLNQSYKSLDDEAFDLGQYSVDSLKYNYSLSPNKFPLIIHLVAMGDGSSEVVQSQYSYLTFKEIINQDPLRWDVSVIYQKVQYGQKVWEVKEMFGIDRAAAGDSSADITAGRECVVCLSEERDTAVLPCRHMCLCAACAVIMRIHSNTCPVCRQPAESLLQLPREKKSES